jgi:hypothetical protein
MGAIERSGVDEHAEGLLAAGRPDHDAPGRRAPEFDPHVPDRIECERLEARARSALGPAPGDDQMVLRQEHRGTDPAKLDEERLGRDILGPR